MATIAEPARTIGRDDRFFFYIAMAMAATVVIGFTTQLAMGRSTFASPLRVHLHAVTFMGWVAIFLTQSWLATRGPIYWHRRLGWFAVGWMVLMLVGAIWVIVAMARNGTIPFFFVPTQLLVGDPIMMLCFVGLTSAAVTLRRRTDWHARLHVCGMAALMGPAFGRILPLPLMIPVGFEIANLAGLAFPVAGMVVDRRRTGSVHPAWFYGIAAIVGALALTDLITYSPLGEAIYAATTEGSPGAAIPALEYPPPPDGPLMTGR